MQVPSLLLFGAVCLLVFARRYLVVLLEHMGEMLNTNISDLLRYIVH